ncbi:MAG: LytTR family DNA-binding domain-containing protein [Bacteroidia bacterium]|nr:LytTR family DNA-binding domain-containing protein [Bacteroidia bacterium]
MNKKPNQFVQLLNKEIRLLLSISFGIFLFILFFQPFAIEKFDFNNRLLFVGGFGAIDFLLMFLFRVVLPWMIQKNNQDDKEPVLTSYLSGFIILILCSVAFTFYLRYVGSVSISFYVVFKIVLICLVPPLILKLYDVNKELIQQNESLISERKVIQKQIEKYEEDNLNKSIEFISETNTENLTLIISEVVFFQSADNYVEIAYMDGDKIKKELIRNTLKNIELQIKQYSNFIRCHRTCIANMHYIEKLNQDYSSHWITIKGYPEKIPVSRQYLLKLKEAL